MPQKMRQLKSALTKAGFTSRSAKGSHTYWEHSQHPDLYITISGHNGDDAGRYQERDVKKTHRGGQAKKMNPHHYSMLIQWDDEDNIYIISVPELKIKTHGKTYEEAIKNALEVIALWLEVAIQDGRPIPPPQKYAA